MDEQKKCPFTTIGTPQCGALFALAGAAIALMLLYIGFWRTLLVAALAGLGYFLGRSKNKSESIKRLLNKTIPPEKK